MPDSEIKLRESAQAGMSGSDGGKAVIRFDSQFLRIEELINRKTFSREEISHLLAVLNSRLDSELEKEPNAGAGGNTDQAMKISGIDRTPTGERHHLIRRTTNGTFSETLNIPEGVGASPIDIARAYMAGRSSEQGQNLYSFMHKGQRAEPSNNYTPQPLMLSPLSRPSICWPGAMVDDHHGHMKQPSHSNRIVSRGYPRTPYSRTALSGSSNKVKSTPDGSDDYGFGPIRRIRNKLSSEVRPGGSILSESKEILAGVLKSNARSNYLTDKKNMEPGETSGVSKCLPYDNALGFSEKDDPITHSSSSQTVRKTLEHLKQNNPMIKEKEAAFTLLTSRGEENVSSFHSVEVAPHQKVGLSGLHIPDEFRSCNSKANHEKKICEEGGDIAKYADKENPKAPRSVFTDSGIMSGANSVPAFGLEGYSVAAVKDSKEKALNDIKHGRENRLSNGMDVESVADFTTTGFSKNHRSKPFLPSIFVNKPENGPAFTFPISSASSGGLSEPPTPSIMPTSTIIQPEFSGMPTCVPSFSSGTSKPPTSSILPTSTDIRSEPSGMSTAAPSFSFGTNDPTQRLVFSFPLTSNTSMNDAAPPPKYTFGSEDKARLAFNSFQCH